MKKRAKICFYIFIVCAFFALGILGYFVINPKNDNVMVGSKKFVTFNEIPNASVYALSVNRSGEESADYKAYYKINKEEINDKENKFLIEVKIDDKKVAEESYVQEILSTKNNKMDCLIKEYQLTFFDEGGEEIKTLSFEKQALVNVDKDTLCCVVSEYFDDLFTDDGKYHIICNAYNEDGTLIDNSTKEFDYDYYAYYIDDFARRDSIFINGKTIDYVIDDKEEFKEFVWHSILYRENDVNFFINTTEITESNINSLTIEAINDYPEYDGLYDSEEYANVNGKIGKLVNFNYYLDFNFTKSYKTLESMDKSTFDEVKDNLHEKDKSFNADYITVTTEENEERHFPIDEVEQEVLVYNTEQLFMVVQYGAKPIFLNEGDEGYDEKYEVVKTVYNNARSELLKINNSDNLTDYQKALNIYRYLCGNVVYDMVTYSYMVAKNDQSVFTFGSFNCFYLEGVFLDLDNQCAVCDGLAKAYTLLCRIEGVPCVKVNGTAQGENHAWNKVGLQDSIDNETKWLYVDTTWGVYNYDDNKEVMTHTYFLFSNESMRRVEFESELDVSNDAPFDYYSKTNYSFVDDDSKTHSGNIYINSDSELKDIFEFVKYKLNEKKQANPDKEASFVLEVKFSNSFYFDRTGNARIILNIDKSNVTPSAWFNYFGIDDSYGCEWLNKVGNDVVIFRFYI